MAQLAPDLALDPRPWDDATRMLGVDEARERILAAFKPLAAERQPIVDALGQILAVEAIAGANVPPFANAAMDGFALLAADTLGATPTLPVPLRVVGEAAAGHLVPHVVTPGTAVRIMTGAPVPEGADAVVRFEETDEHRSGLTNRGRLGQDIGICRTVAVGANIRPAGEDMAAGETVLTAGTVLRPVEIGVLAALNRTHVSVHRRPRVAIVATGDEVVDPGAQLLPGQVRNTNSSTVAALVRRHGGIPLLLGVARDATDELRDTLRSASDADLVITTGGVSVGDYDMVKQVLCQEGRIALWQVRLKPGKPLAFGWLGATPLIGLPGNPVAAVVAFEQFVRPAILKMLGRRDLSIPTARATLRDRVENWGGRRHFVRVWVEATASGYDAFVAGPQGAGILSSLTRANGLLIIPEELTLAEAEMTFSVQLLDQDG